MVPDFDLQLQVTLKALRDVVAPAVDPNNSVAKEQLQLALGTINIVRSRLPLARKFVRRQSEAAIDLAEKVAATIGKTNAADVSAIKSAVEIMRQTLDDPEADTADIEGARQDLASATSAAVEASPPNPKLTALVLKESETPINRERAWYIGAGFEPNPKALNSIEEMVK